ncbi:Alanine--tRNA ligase [Mesomycoplasma conjunctivae]|uniref:Alanine--tRNA ligase n=1 Tax=Mesomycoplasma conjunctivae (strain ATCC 25834 / NCTC 10147 / HRC/581) TaxID=572263 RepID=C5J6A3_MESCH|nr:alanine--tRNA ligase [Mesomycoplasma conjunctivae]CAT04995.1 Alanyl-tRNA synthetase [Mesomycoplasma conjunctivae]VEU66344.1 Alanine--tRNA ligase [Mesomycoplasma conjunctivae]
MKTNLSSKQIRQLWLDFFASKNHLIVESKSLIPQNDPSLLWINSGVATLKEYFTGHKQPPSKRITNSQKAIRTNDIENVGITSRHHTMFEMLGNFSIGDYFKKEAIEFAFEFLVYVLKMDLDKLYITYFSDDLETKKYWQDLGIQDDHLIAGNQKTNFWDIGLGPCGPCSEIYYDRGEKFDSRGIELLKNDIENDRFIEIWNIVFSEFNNDGEGNYTPLVSKNIDTGAGFERIVSILQNGPTNFDTDLFLPIILEVEKLSDFKYDVDNYFKKDKKQTKINTYFKVIADHIRSVVNAINDGVEPSNTHRGYIIRRLIRRAFRMGRKLGIKQAFLYKLVGVVKSSLIYDIDEKKVAKIIKKEEELFEKTIENGEILLNREFEKNGKNFNIEIVFKMFETYGFPIELTQEILEEKGLKLDFDKIEELKEKHANLSRGKQHLGMNLAINSLALIKGKESEFVGYEHLEQTAKILFLANNESLLETTQEDEISYAIFDKTPFYATGGGQKHDQGLIIQGDNKIEIIKVFKDKYFNNIHVFKGVLNKNEEVKLIVDEANRRNLERNHSATHLLFKALREQFGLQIKQLGSDNNENRLTFDFPVSKKPTDEELAKVESLVNFYIQSSTPRKYLNTTIKEAEKLNAIMTLEEAEYMDPKNVRLVHFQGITTDLCGGTHIANTSLIQKFKIISCQNKGSGVFRIRAITTLEKYYDYLTQQVEQKELSLAAIEQKNRQFDPFYKMQVHRVNDLEILNNNLDLAIKQAKLDTLQLIKNKKKEEKTTDFIFNQEKIFTFNNQDFYIDFITDKQINSKQLAATLREEHANITFVLLQEMAAQKILVVVSSKTNNSLDILNKINKIFDGKGGGNKIIAQGILNQKEVNINKIKEIIWM